jgi:hypothetical protein
MPADRFYFLRTRDPAEFLTGVGTYDDPMRIAYGTIGDADRADIIAMVTAMYEFMGLTPPEFLTMPTRLHEPMYLILQAQAENLARIQTGAVLAGTSGDGTQIELWGPEPNLIRLYDTPMNHIESAALENWERVITIMPLNSSPESRIIRRTDRSFRYRVNFLVRLTEREMIGDREQVLTGNRRPSNVLAEKAHRLIHDFHHCFFDNHHLVTDDCPQGLVDDQDYNIVWEGGVEYPYALFTAEVTGSRSSW